MAKTMTIEEWEAVGRQVKLIRRELSTLLTMLNTPKTCSTKYLKITKALSELKAQLSNRMYEEHAWRVQVDSDDLFKIFYGDD